MASAQQHRLTPTDRRIEAAIKAINRRSGRAAKMTAIRAALNFMISESEARRGIWRLEDAGLVFRYSMRTGYYAGPPPPHASTRHHPLVSPQWAKHPRCKAFVDDIALRQTELRLLVEVGRPPAAPAKPPRTGKRTPQGDAPRQMALPIIDAA